MPKIQGSLRGDNRSKEFVFQPQPQLPGRSAKKVLLSIAFLIALAGGIALARGSVLMTVIIVPITVIASFCLITLIHRIPLSNQALGVISIVCVFLCNLFIPFLAKSIISLIIAIVGAIIGLIFVGGMLSVYDAVTPTYSNVTVETTYTDENGRMQTVTNNYSNMTEGMAMDKARMDFDSKMRQ